MPGFSIQGVGAGRAESFKPYYNFCWEIEQLIGFSPSENSIFAREATLPTFTVGTEDIDGSSLVYRYASKVIWDPISITFYDTEGLLPIIRNWRTRVWSPRLGLQVASVYKKQSIIKHFLPDMAGEIKWTMYGSWPSTIKYGDLTYTSSDAKIVTTTVTYDWASEGGDDVERESLSGSSGEVGGNGSHQDGGSTIGGDGPRTIAVRPGIAN